MSVELVSMSVDTAGISLGEEYDWNNLPVGYRGKWWAGRFTRFWMASTSRRRVHLETHLFFHGDRLTLIGVAMHEAVGLSQ